MYNIGIDLGGTKVKFGLFKSNVSIEEIEIPTPQNHVSQTFSETIANLVEDKAINKIGISSAGLIDVKHKKILKASNIPQVPKDIALIMENRFSVEAKIENDANCAGLAETMNGAAKGFDKVVCITIGTGIGGSFIINQSIYRGANYGAGEFGHMTIEHNGLPCACGQKGCWEVYASGRSIERRLNEIKLLNKVDSKQVLNENNDSSELSILKQDFLDYLARGLCIIQQTLDPDIIVLGGGVVDSSNYWWDDLNVLVQKYTNKPIYLKKAELGNRAGLVGSTLI
ncbi:glucokinase [Halolactibacillus alkaliphilus]|uniref:Glucokinase n=1 Tax=Halolactibacillus alkaliphilus TaxID=442899 RepID=A0A511WZN2_9BACI|nr:ROK family protein [Halolactibacillus alkaliphilus]GEN56156.1 glucokinase [Halolactibacillus alkaliphilus]GGN66836.1 glucokinase [Halolactibacillus alkaliphilus]SFO72019.1 glucokinase [Halolactibacillus alkaliphilus]